MEDKTYTFYREEQKYETSNLSAFCRERGLRRRHIDEVIAGKRKSHHGFEYRWKDQAFIEDTLQAAEIAARSSGDPEYEALVMSRVEKVRRGEPINIRQGKSEKGEDTITVLD